MDLSRFLPARRATRYAMAAALVVLAVSSFVLIARPDEAPEATPSPTPVPRVAVSPDVVRAVPGLEQAAHDQIVAEIGAFLGEVYERAFLPPLPAPTPGPEDPESPAPTPIPRPSIGPFFTEGGRTTLAGSDVYEPGPDATVQHGELRFRGILTTEAGAPVDAVLTVHLSATGGLLTGEPGSTETVGMRMEQRGELHLSKLPDGWRIVGFDLTLNQERQVPGATPGAQAWTTMRTDEAGWTP